MAYVKGLIGEKIEKLRAESVEMFNEGRFNEAKDKLEYAWELLPEEKNQWAEAYTIVSYLLSIGIAVNDNELLNKWVKVIYIVSLDRYDCGEREMWEGRVRFELNELEKAKELFEIANKKSKGRCFNRGDKDKKYKNFLKAK